jgi:hypothetical protein
MSRFRKVSGIAFCCARRWGVCRRNQDLIVYAASFCIHAEQ